MSEVLELTKSLISRQSVTPEDAGCQEMFAQRLRALGFELEQMNFGEVKNLWATYGDRGPLLVFAGHTDVVPTGDIKAWSSPPFEPNERDGKLYGRGAADMKGSLAAMLVACERFLENRQPCNIRLAFLLTSDEEGPAVDGTQRVMHSLDSRGEHFEYCIVGEPSSTKKVGDVIKNGRRGSMSGKLKVIGQQGHIAYPHLAENPIHAALPALAALTAIEWDAGNEFFQPTSLQISNVSAGTGAGNVIPGELSCDFNLRFSTEWQAEDIQQRIHQALDAMDIKYELEWTLFGRPFLTQGGELIAATRRSITAVTGRDTELSTGGGTSDGRFIAPYGVEVLELGPCNASIHKIDEHVLIEDLYTLTDIYEAILNDLDRFHLG